jgi:hypothetical protein
LGAHTDEAASRATQGIRRGNSDGPLRRLELQRKVTDDYVDIGPAGPSLAEFLASDAAEAEADLRERGALRIRLRRTTRGIGIAFREAVGGTVCLVGEIWPGSDTAEWNRANPSMAIRTGDQILSINGTRGSGKEMIRVSREVLVGEVVELAVKSYSLIEPSYSYF